MVRSKESEKTSPQPTVYTVHPRPEAHLAHRLIGATRLSAKNCPFVTIYRVINPQIHKLDVTHALILKPDINKVMYHCDTKQSSHRVLTAEEIFIGNGMQNSELISL